MYRFKRLLITAMWLSIAQTLTAQHHHNAWFRSTLSIPLEDKIRTDVEFQHRRQNGFENRNMLDNNLMFTFRDWVHYQHTPNLSSISPFAYFSHYRIIQDLKLTVFEEFFINVAGTSSAQFTEHNRTRMNIEYSVLPKLKFDVGHLPYRVLYPVCIRQH